MNLNATYEQMLKAANDNQAALRKLAELNLSTWDKLVAKQLEMMGLCFEAGSKQFASLQEAKGADEVLSKQTVMARECGEKLMAKNREMVELLTSTRDQYAQWVEASVSQVKEQVAQAGETVRKAA